MSTLPPALTPFVWTRKSNKHDKTVISLEVQLDACLARATADGLDVPPENIYRVRFSGVDLWDIPELQDLFRRIERDRQQPKIIYCYVQDRMIRGEEGDEIFYLTTRFRRANTKLFLVNTGVEITSGDIARRVQTLFDGHKASTEVEDIKRRTMGGKLKRIHDGKIYNFATELYGYRRDKEKGVRVVHEPEAAIVRRIFDLASLGWGVYQIASKLNADGILTPGKSKRMAIAAAYWNPTAVADILTNEAYKGVTKIWKRKSNGKRRDESENLLLPDGTTPPIVAPELWDRVREVRRANRGDKQRNMNRPILLRGLVVCSQCGNRLYADETKFRCVHQKKLAGRPATCQARSVSIADLDEKVWATVRALLSEPARLQEAIAETETPVDSREDIEQQLGALRRQSREIERQQRRLVDQMLDAEPEWLTIFHDKKRELSRLAETAAAALRQAESLLAESSARESRARELVDFCRTFAEKLEDFGFAEKRLALEALGVQVIVTGATWRLKFTRW